MQGKTDDIRYNACIRVTGLNPSVEPFIPHKSTKEQGSLPTKTSPKSKKSLVKNPDQAFDIPLINRFQILQDLSGNSDADNAFDSNSASTQAIASPTRERIREYNEERNASTQLASDPVDIPQPTCKEYWQCKEQNGVEFGCIPLSPITLFTGDPTYWEKIPDIITAHELIRQSGVANFWV